MLSTFSGYADLELSSDSAIKAWPDLTLPRSVQAEGDLGLRIFQALAGALASGREVAIVVGSDSPGLPASHISALLESAADVTLGLPSGTIGSVNKPDSLWTYELGARWELANRTLLLEGSIYQTDWKDVLVQFATAAVISITNAGDARIKGGDIGLVWRTPLEGLNLQASAAYNNAKFTSVLGKLSVGTAIQVGGRVPNVPKTTLTLAADYAHELGGLDGVTGTLYAGYSFRDDTIDASTKGLKSGKLDDLTLRAGLKKDPWRIETFVTNALNDKDPAVISSTALQIMYPRRIGVRVGVDF